MILDAENRYSNAQALTSTAVSTDIIDHGIDRDLGKGEPLVVMVTLDVAADGTTGDETYVATLQSATDAAFTTPLIIGSVTIPDGSVAGSKFFINVPPDENMDRFSRISVALGGTTPSVTLSAFLLPLSMAETDYKAFADGFTIS